MKRVIAVLTSCMVAICFLWSGEAFAATDYSIMRVTLTSMGTPTNISVTVNGNYSIPEKPLISLEKKSYKISIANGQLMLSDGTTSTPMGARFTIKRHEGANPNQLRISNTSYGGRDYLGDFEVRLMENRYIQLINCIYLETYLYGVVPYEMSDSFPIEALKAQAIAARTYAVSHYSSIKDTTWDQVYKGYNLGYSHTIQAVNETAKQVMKTASGVLVSANYSASNGGQTELPSNAWLSGSNAVYNIMKDDPYDLQNPSSVVDKLIFPKVANSTPMAVCLYSILQKELISSLNPAVYGIVPTDITNMEIRGFAVNKPYKGQGQTASKRMTNISITLFFVAKNKSNPAISPVLEPIIKSIDITIDSMKTKLLSTYPLTTRLFTVTDNKTTGAFELIGKGWGHGVGMSQRGAQQMGSIGKSCTEILNFYYPNTPPPVLIVANPPALTPKPAVLALTATPTSLAAASATNNSIKLTWTAVTGANGYGVYRATSATGTYTLLTTTTTNSYTNTNLTTGTTYYYKINAYRTVGTTKVYSNQTAAVSAKPIPATPPPVVTKTMGTVKVSGSLNIRSGPNTSSKIVGSLRNGNQIEILEHNSTWFKIKSGAIIGYVMGKYVQLANPAPTPPPATPPPVVTKTMGTVKVSGSLNIRSGPNTSSKIVGSLRNGNQIEILEHNSTWFKIKSGAIIGYVMGKYVQLANPAQNPPSSNPPPPAAPPPGNKFGVVTASKLTIRNGASTRNKSVGYVLRGKRVTILGSSNGWYQISYAGLSGYVSASYVRLESNTVPTGGTTPTPTNGQATVTASSLRLRSAPSTSSTIITSLANGQKVTILERTGSWVKVRSLDGRIGYVMGSYIR